MATIPSATNQLRHVRKTINFDGGANNGNLGDEVPVFTTTGRVLLEKGFVYCSDALVCSAPDNTNIALFTSGAILGLDPVLLTGVATGLWLTQDVNGWDYWGRDIGRGFGQPAVSTNITLKVDQDVTGADITDGTLIIDIWYYPVSDDGALAGDDIDAGYMPADVKAWLATAAATPTVAGVPEVDLTHVGGTTTNVAALATNVDAILTDTGTTLQAELDAIEAAVITNAAGVDIAADIIAIKAETAAILDDTDLIDDATSGLAKIATDVAAVLVDTSTTLQAELDGIQADTEDIQTRLPAALVGGRMDATVDATGMESGAIDAILTRTMTEAYAAAGAEMTVAQALYEICQVFSEFAISGSTITVKQRDGSTTAMTFTLDSAIQPTSRTRAT